MNTTTNTQNMKHNMKTKQQNNKHTNNKHTHK